MIIQQLLNGLIVGGVYALFAIGFTLVFGIHQVLNLAHGAVFMTGAFIALYAVLGGWPLWAGFLLAMLGSGLLSVLIEFGAFRKLRKSGPLVLEFGAIPVPVHRGRRHWPLPQHGWQVHHRSARHLSPCYSML